MSPQLLYSVHVEVDAGQNLPSGMLTTGFPTSPPAWDSLSHPTPQRTSAVRHPRVSAVFSGVCYRSLQLLLGRVCKARSGYEKSAAARRNRMLHALLGNSLLTASVMATLEMDLVAHGVPQEVSKVRAQAMKSAVGDSALEKALVSNDAKQRWVALKQAANNAHFRLLSPEEATQYHIATKEQRRKQGKGVLEDPWTKDDPWKQSGLSQDRPSSQGGESSSGHKSKLVEVSLRKGDWVDDNRAPVPVVKLEDVVPSATGVCALDEATAVTLLGDPLKSWSVGPLAVIILSSSPPKVRWPFEELFFFTEDACGSLHRVRGFLVQLGDMKDESRAPNSL